MSRQRQELPSAERELLRGLTGADLKFRARLLNEEGWSLASIANAFTPPRQRSSVRAWVLSAPAAAPPSTHTLPPIPIPSSSSSSESTIPTPESEHFSPVRRARRIYNPDAPVLSPAERERVAHLAPLARRYRSRMSSGGPHARANRELTETCRRLYRRGASVRELSLAAGVTYRAMSRRIGAHASSL